MLCVVRLCSSYRGIGHIVSLPDTNHAHAMCEESGEVFMVLRFAVDIGLAGSTYFRYRYQKRTFGTDPGPNIP